MIGAVLNRCSATWRRVARETAGQMNTRNQWNKAENVMRTLAGKTVSCEVTLSEHLFEQLSI